MPSVRVVSWNSGGEAGGRGATLALTVTAINGTPPPVDLVAIQEARVNIVPPGSIYATLSGGAPPFAGFSVPPDHPRELGPGQPFAVGVNRSYLVSWQPGTLMAPHLVSGGPAARVNLAPVLMPMPNGVETYIAGLGLGLGPTAALRQAAANIRPPVRKTFTLTVGGIAHNVIFYTWHAELQANWLAATWATVGLGGNPFAGPGMYPAFQFFQACDTYTADLAGLTANDILIIAGDLNITAADVGNPTIFPAFIGASSNLSHILVHSPSGALALAQTANYGTPFPPHAILTAEAQW